MNKVLILSVFISAIFSPALAGEKNLPPIDFFVGNYEVVGRDENLSLYQGTVSIKNTNDRLEFVRTLNGNTTNGHGNIINYCADGCPAIRVEYEDGVIGIYQYFTDADNYAIMIGTIGGETQEEESGKETLYPTP